MNRYSSYLGILVVLALVSEVFALLPFRLVRVAHAAVSISVGVNTTSTANATCYTTGSFTPAANDYVLLAANMTGTTQTTGTATSSNSSESWTAASTTSLYSGNVVQWFVPNQLAPNSARTMTVCTPADAQTGIGMIVFLLSGMTKVGSSSIRQVSSTPQLAAGRIPSSTFDGLTLNTNPIFGAVGNSAASPTGTPAFPSIFTAKATSTFITPSTGFAVGGVASGYATTSIAWTGQSATAFGEVSLELDASAAGGGGSTPTPRRRKSQVISDAD